MLDEVERWCFPCRSQYPHQPLGDWRSARQPGQGLRHWAGGLAAGSPSSAPVISVDVVGAVRVGGRGPATAATAATTAAPTAARFGEGDGRVIGGAVVVVSSAV